MKNRACCNSPGTHVLDHLRIINTAAFILLAAFAAKAQTGPVVLK